MGSAVQSARPDMPYQSVQIIVPEFSLPQLQYELIPSLKYASLQYTKQLYQAEQE